MDPISARQAATLLAERGLSRSQARRLLATGIVGEPVRTPSALLYDAGRIRELAARPAVDILAVPFPADRALLEVRRGPAPEGDTVDSLTLTNAGWVVGVQIAEAISRYGCLPVAVTSSGFVLAVHDAIEVHPAGRGRTRLRVRPPSTWAEAFRGRRLYSPAGNHWLLWTPEITPTLSPTG